VFLVSGSIRYHTFALVLIKVKDCVQCQKSKNYPFKQPKEKGSVGMPENLQN
jgi:hypothetical protein